MSPALASLVGRLLLSAIFVYSGIGKLTAPGRTASMIAGHGLPFATACAYAAGLFELAVGVLLIVGLKVRPAALAAVAYLALVTALFHWHPAMHGDHGQMLQLLKNLGLAGGLVLLSSTGPGSMALERG